MTEDNDRFKVSNELWSRAEKVIPAGTQTLSKAPNQFVGGLTPKYLDRGLGAHVWDVDGNEYIDYPMALGPILLGYNYPPVTEAVIERVKLGTTFTLMHPLEVEVAELLTDLVPSAEMVRFGKNGADVTSAAVKVARAATGRDHIAYCGYHGCQDWYAVTTERNKGIPEVLGTFMHPFTYNDIESLERVFLDNTGNIGAVIMEVPGVDPVKYEDGSNFLHKVKEVAHRHGALFILDEIVTGFRYSLGGAQGLFNVTPDLSTFGKGMANGFAISALVGKREYMKELEEVFFSMTYSGDTTGLAAAKATIEIVRDEPVLETIWSLGDLLRRGIIDWAEEFDINLTVDGNPPRSGLTFRDDEGNIDFLQRSIFMQETIERGVLFGGPIFTTYSHTEADIEATVDSSRRAFEVIRRGLDGGNLREDLRGTEVGTVFRKRD